MKRIVIGSSLLLLVLGACGPGRTAAATQPTPKAFDPAGSDPKAVAVVDAMQTALGGADKWSLVKQIRWTQKTLYGDELRSWVIHAWDIWNGRHRCEVADMSSYAKPSAEKPNPDPPKYSIAMYDLFDVDSSSGSATYDGDELGSDDRKKLKKTCFTVWKQQSYQLAMFFKLKDPGVKLTYEGQIKEMNIAGVGVLCKEGCDSIKVSFAPEVGTDTWWVHINTATKMPELIESSVPGKGARLGFIVGGWIEVNGLKFPGKLQNAGLHDEIFQITDIQIGDPDARLYIPAVRG